MALRLDDYFDDGERVREEDGNSGAQRVSESRQGEGPNKEDDDYDDDSKPADLFAHLPVNESVGTAQYLLGADFALCRKRVCQS